MRKPDDQFAAALLTRLSTALLLGASWCVTQHSRDVLILSRTAARGVAYPNRSRTFRPVGSRLAFGDCVTS